MFLLQMPPAFLRDTHVEQTPDQGSRVPTGPHLLALQEEGARLPRSRGGRPAVRARVKLSDIPEPNATKASWEVSAFLEGGNGLLDLLFVSRRSGQKVRRPGLSPGPTAGYCVTVGGLLSLSKPLSVGLRPPALARNEAKD